jgi:hypothetical protein
MAYRLDGYVFSIGGIRLEEKNRWQIPLPSLAMAKPQTVGSVVFAALVVMPALSFFPAIATPQ